VYPKSRIDALTDGVFSVAMTLLVLNLTLPDYGIHDEADLTAAIRSLWSKFIPYALSFYVLGSTWIANVKLKSSAAHVDRSYAFWWLLYLLIATCVPFSTSVVGRYTQLRPAIWLYCANMAALAATGYRLVVLLPDLHDDEYSYDRKFSLVVLLVSTLACFGLSFRYANSSLWIYLSNGFAPQLSRLLTRRRTAH
jgi:uncharacterized membrane protein